MKINNKFLIIFITAVVVRVILAAIFMDEWPAGSSVSFRIGLAENIASGNGFSYNNNPNLYQTPVYPFFLALIISTFGLKWWAVGLFQGILEGFSSVGISKIGDKFTKYGWYAGLIYALYPYAAMQSRSIVDTPLFVFLFVTVVYFYIVFIENSKIHSLILASIFLGIGILNRPSIVCVIPAFLICLMVMGLNWKKVALYAITTIIIASLIPLGWVLRNYKLTKNFPILSVGGNHTLWYGHNKYIYTILRNDESPDLIGIDSRFPMEPNFKVKDFFVVNPEEQIKLGKRCASIVKNWIVNNRNQVYKYTLLKAKKFLDWEYDIKQSKEGLQRLRILIYRYTNAPITILGWFGLCILFLKRKKDALFIGFILLGFILVHVITNFSSRHKIPLDALLITMIPISTQFLVQKLSLLKKRIVKA